MNTARVSAEAQRIQLSRVLLTVLAAFFYGLGYAVATILVTLWRSVTWSLAAARLGWRDAMAKGVEAHA
jgi:hypothetical protein